MSRLVKLLRNKKKVIFDRGKFDDWCVYVVGENGEKKAPLDIEYFRDLQQIARDYGTNKVYDDFVVIYQNTTGEIDPKTLKIIDGIVDSYGEEHKDIMEQWFSVLYAGMIAEENKKHAILKKRIKRLGMHQILLLNKTAEFAANFSKGKKWKELDSTMRKLGF